MIQLGDYKTLMPECNEIGNKSIRYTLHCNGDCPELLEGGGLSFVFVLQGEVDCSFHIQANTILKSSQIMVINKQKLTALQCKGDTVLLEFVASPRMTQLMTRISRIFNMSRSEVITLNSPIHSWCEKIFNDLLLDSNRDEEYYTHKCNMLTLLLLDYPRQELGTLYIPLYACTI